MQRFDLHSVYTQKKESRHGNKGFTKVAVGGASKGKRCREGRKESARKGQEKAHCAAVQGCKAHYDWQEKCWWRRGLKNGWKDR